jgi:hypothetical protein
LSTKPRTTTWRNSCFDNSDLQVRTLSTKDISCGQSARSRSNNDNIRLCEFIKVRKVTASHGPRNLTLANRRKGKSTPLTVELVKSLGLAIDSDIDAFHGHNTKAIGSDMSLLEKCCWRCHIEVMGGLDVD